MPLLVFFSGFQLLVSGLVEMVHSVFGSCRPHLTEKPYRLLETHSVLLFSLLTVVSTLPMLPSSFQVRYVLKRMPHLTRLTHMSEIGVLTAFTLKDGTLSPQYDQALGIFFVSHFLHIQTLLSCGSLVQIAWMSVSFVLLLGA